MSGFCQPIPQNAFSGVFGDGVNVNANSFDGIFNQPTAGSTTEDPMLIEPATFSNNVTPEEPTPTFSNSVTLTRPEEPTPTFSNSVTLTRNKVPPFIEELFPTGASINYNDGGTTTVQINDGSCSFSADDIFILLMLKESYRDQSSVVWGNSNVTVTERSGEQHVFPRTELDKLSKDYHSFWDVDSVEFVENLASGDGLGEAAIDAVGGDVADLGELKNNEWKEKTPQGYQMASWAFAQTELRMNGILGYGGLQKPSGLATNLISPLHTAAAVALQFINWDPKPEGRPGQGKAGIFDKCGQQITTAQGALRASRGEVVYRVSSFGGPPTILNYELGYNDEDITDYGCFFGKPQLKHPAPREKNHPDTFICRTQSVVMRFEDVFR